MLNAGVQHTGERIMKSHSGHRVTIDLRSTEERLHAFAAAHHLSIAASVRKAIDAMLTSAGETDDDSENSGFLGTNLDEEKALER
jgi:plasmid stability protein